MKNMIKQIRTKQGLTQEELASISGFTVVHINRLENGVRKLTQDNMKRIADALKVEIEELISETSSPIRSIPVVGIVGAGGSVDLVDAYSKGDGLEHIACPPDMDPAKTVAVKVQGESMMPFIWDGWYLYYQERVFGVPLEYINRLCIVKIADSDSVCVKVISKGEQIGKFNLVSYNESETPTMKNRAVEWSAKVEFIKPV